MAAHDKLSSAAETAMEATDEYSLRVPYYCEENAWRVAYRKTQLETNQVYYVLFISNAIKAVHMFFQKAGAKNPDHSVCWDYHVVVIGVRSTDEVSVYDIDSILPYPLPLDEYLQQSFPYNTQYYKYAPRFRLIPSSVYLDLFSSDRSHMFETETQTWKAPPPPYACLKGRPTKASSTPGDQKNERNNLQYILDFSDDRDYPCDSRLVPPLLTLDQLSEYFLKHY